MKPYLMPFITILICFFLMYHWMIIGSMPEAITELRVVAHTFVLFLTLAIVYNMFTLHNIHRRKQNEETYRK